MAHTLTEEDRVRAQEILDRMDAENRAVLNRQELNLQREAAERAEEESHLDALRREEARMLEEDRLRLETEAEHEQERERLRWEQEDNERYEREQRRGHPGYDEYGYPTHLPVPPPLEALAIRKPRVEMPSLQKLRRVKDTVKTAEVIKTKDAEQIQKSIVASKERKKSLQSARVKQAVGLQLFSHQMGISSLFYRYVRFPDENIAKGKRVYTGPTGGLCLLIHMLGRGSYRFSFALCEKDDKFIKDEARRLCQERFSKGQYLHITEADSSASILENIKRGCENNFYNLNRDPQEPKLHLKATVHPTTLKKLYKFVVFKLENGDYSCREKT